MKYQTFKKIKSDTINNKIEEMSYFVSTSAILMAEKENDYVRHELPRSKSYCT